MKKVKSSFLHRQSLTRNISACIYATEMLWYVLECYGSPLQNLFWCLFCQKALNGPSGAFSKRRRNSIGQCSTSYHLVFASANFDSRYLRLCLSYRNVTVHFGMLWVSSTNLILVSTLSEGSQWA